ncbi:serine protease 44-like [Penaeus indicus]|uniref:serine protease 44-like n=1 Tax=Penaeus indicus TaxID=29960 RepID=UPI00300CE31C
MEKPGSNEGSGIYMCDTSLSWRPLAGSPPLDALQLFCLNAGCGYVPEPTPGMAVDRRWSWVRLLYRNDQPACSLTLVANHAAITAAHCVTKNPASREIPDIDEFTIEMPGYTVKPKNIFIHPQYDPNSRYAHDIAVITFSTHSSNILPTVCIADEAVIPSRERKQVIFVLAENRQTPEWHTRSSKWSTNCLGLSPSSTFCRDQLDLKESQFCAQYEGIGITSGSSGGPYLADIGTGVDEVWVMMGVLSTVNTGPSCSQGHLVYSNVANNAQWLKECVFYDRCNTFFSTLVQGR